MLRIYPDLSEDLLLNLFHKGVKASWTTGDVDWDQTLAMSEDECRALAHLLSPVYLGEQSAMLGAAAVLPQMAQAGETTAQIYLTSFIMDEARHFEVLTRLYERMNQLPMGVREMPEMLRYHHRLRQGDRMHWVWGILISDLFAKNFYQMFAKSQPDALFGGMSSRILQDESRHQAFASHYLSKAWPMLPDGHRASLKEARNDLLQIMGQMTRRLKDDSARLSIDGEGFLARLEDDIDRHARKIGFFGPKGPGGGHAANGGRGAVVSMARHVRHWRPERPGTKAQAQASCDDCYLSALCRTRMVAGGRVR